MPWGDALGRIVDATLSGEATVSLQARQRRRFMDFEPKA
jgi:hypothetical protein